MDHYTLFQEYLQADHQIDEFYHTLAQALGLSDSALWVLWCLVERGDGCTQKDICRQVSISFLSLRPREGREVSLFLTAQGQELVREKVLPIMAAERAAAGGLTEEELRDMIRLSQKWLSLFRKAAASLPKP